MAAELDESKILPEMAFDAELPVLHANGSQALPGDDKYAGEASVSEHDSETDPETLRRADHPWKIKGPAVLCVLLFDLGSNWASASLSPLKSTLKTELGINNAQYGVITSASSLVNTVVPIVGGVAMDWFGPETGSLLSSGTVLLGTIISGLGANKSNLSILVAGNVVMGLGSSVIETCQTKLYAHWFYGNHLGLLYGADIALIRVINTIAKATAVPIAERTGWWGWSIWISAVMSAIALIINIIYVLFDRRLPSRTRLVPTRTLSHKREGTRTLSLAALSLIPGAFWIITLTQLFQLGSANAYAGISADLITQTRGSSALVAGYTSSLSQIIPIFVTPCVGALFDRFGRRMYYVSATAVVWVLVYVLMGFTSVNPLVPTILHSVALSFSAIPFIVSIPLLAPSQAYLGTAFGVWKAFTNAGSVIMSVSTGAIQDITPTGKHTYDNVLYFLIALKGVDFFYGLVYSLLDRRYFGSVLKMSEGERQRKVQTDGERDDPKKTRLLQPVRFWTWAGSIVLGAMIVVAWVVYLVYARRR